MPLGPPETVPVYVPVKLPPLTNPVMMMVLPGFIAPVPVPEKTPFSKLPAFKLPDPLPPPPEPPGVIWITLGPSGPTV